MTNKQFSEFEGLFNRPPGILINGQYYALTDKHKVIFAGNPLDYGDERKLAPFFQKHGNAVVFQPLSSDCIYEEILKPVFDKSNLTNDQINKIATHILKIYQYICDVSTKEVLITARELQMMALLMRSFMNDYKDANIDQLSQSVCYSIAKNLIPENHRDLFREKFGGNLPTLTKAKTQDSEFISTTSRNRSQQQLHQLLKLRDLRRNSALAVNDAIKYGGLGGMVLEGEPGVGKSEMVFAELRAQGFEKQDPNQPTEHPKPFYYMPVSMQLSDKKALLLRAFDEGAVVVIDEINSSPMMERLLNDLLMGYDENKKRPTNPGFMIIGTQNPAIMGGRREASAALSRRMITEVIEPYTRDEMQNILIQTKKLKPDEAESLVDIYEERLREAKINKLSPMPTFRDLIKCADEYIEYRRQMTSHAKDEIKSADIKSEKTPNHKYAKLINQINDLFESYIERTQKTHSFLESGLHLFGRKPVLTEHQIPAATKLKGILSGNASKELLDDDDLRMLNRKPLLDIYKKYLELEAKTLTQGKKH